MITNRLICVGNYPLIFHIIYDYRQLMTENKLIYREFYLQHE